jgi:RHS repeat-associated protein
VEGTQACQGEPNSTFSLTGDTVEEFPAEADLLTNPASQTYEFFGDVTLSGTIAETDCGDSGEPEPTLLDAWPDATSSCGALSSPASDFPSFALPQEVGPIEQTDANLPGLESEAPDGCGVPTTWTLNFSLEPKVHCKDCEEQGGDGEPLFSSVSAQNQSLGEDVPIVGTEFRLHYESDRAPGGGGDSIASADAAAIGGWTLSVHHAYDPNTHTLFLGDGAQRNGSELGTPVSYGGDVLLTSEDGSEVYVFTTAGQHLKTLRPLTGALEYEFGYDSKGNLVTVTDASSNVTTIERNSSEQPTAIISPYGQTTTLSVDSNGFLNKVTDPLGKSQTFVNASTGLLNSRTDANGSTFTYQYDSNGGLAKDADSLGGFTELTRTNATSGFGWTVGETTAMGRTSTYQSTLDLPWVQDGTKPESEQHTNVGTDGLQTSSSESLEDGQISESLTSPDGTTDSTTLAADPVWGLQVPITTSETLAQGDLTVNIKGSRSTTLGTGSDPFTVTAETDAQTTNDRTYTSTFTGSNRTWVNTSPVGRTLMVGLDSLERLASTQVGGLTATAFSYDIHGRLASTTQGARQMTLSYDPQGFLATVADPLKLTTSFAYDADGDPLTATLPDGEVIKYTYDSNGNLTSLTPPGKSAHAFAYNAVNLTSTYTPPVVTGTGATTYAYDLDLDLKTITRPDSKTIDYGYDSGGRLNSITTPTATNTFTYNSTTGNVATASNATEQIAYGYNGPLPASSTWTGTVAGSISRTYNNNFWVASESINGSNTIAFQYDNDGLVTGAGGLTIQRSSQNGLISGTTLGVATDSRTYNSFGELTGYTASVKGTPVYSLDFTRDDDGRITEETETIGGETKTHKYAYDAAGRLTKAGKHSYTYDSNSNRLTATIDSLTTQASYDAQDRLLTYGKKSFTYTANGELTAQTAPDGTTTYDYDVLGNLVGVTLPDGAKITYLIDAENHRVGREVNGALKKGFLYDGDRLVAELNGSNQIVSQLVYATGANSPDYMIKDGAAYRIFSDQLGSPVLVVDSSTGAIAQQVTYDEFGKVITDSNPGFQPFGFAGGLYDERTKLVRFGARDYDPSIGRWTAKDPVLFDGGDTNLYDYVHSDPVNFADALGTQDVDAGTPDASAPNNSEVVLPQQSPPSLVQQLRQWIRKKFGKKKCEKCTEGEEPPEKEPENGNGKTGPDIAIDIAEHVGSEYVGSKIAEEATEKVGGEVVGQAVGEVVGATATIATGADVAAEGVMAEKHYFDRMHANCEAAFK